MEKTVSVTFCTIISQSHFAWALALNSSLLQFDKNMNMSVLITDTAHFESPFLKDFPNINIIYLEDLCYLEKGEKIIQKYKKQANELRWTLKSVLIMHLLHHYHKVLYCDCDIFFFSPYTFLIEQLDSAAVLLSPHWRTIQPQKNIAQFEDLLKDGMYNGGFIAANQQGYKAMETWANLCLHKCEKDASKGYYDDQRYLDFLPLYFENVQFITHLGCNVANWNTELCQRILRPNGAVWINDSYPIVFIHITKSMIYGVLSAQDKLLYPYIEQFSQVLMSFDNKWNIFQKHEKNVQYNKLKTSLLQRIKNKIHSFLKK